MSIVGIAELQVHFERDRIHAEFPTQVGELLFELAQGVAFDQCGELIRDFIHDRINRFEEILIHERSSNVLIETSRKLFLIAIRSGR